MLIVDSQIHIWTKGIPTNPVHRRMSVYSKDDALRKMDKAGVDAIVIHPPGWNPDSNELAVEAAASIPTALPFWAISLSIVRRAAPW
jgi:hypothetical protein